MQIFIKLSCEKYICFSIIKSLNLYERRLFMKKIFLSAIAAFGFIGMANAADITIYYSPTCPHCHHAQDYTKNNFIYEYPTINVTFVNVVEPAHRAMFIDVLKQCDFASGGVPVIKIGDKCFQGFAESMADDMRSAIEVDMDDAAKQSAADVKKSIAENGDAYRAEHPTPVATVTEYSATGDDATDEKKTNASDNKLASWILIVLGLIIVGFSISSARKNSRK